jgi:hypothetical protein
MLETVRQLTNYGGFIRNKGALKLSGEDKETIDLMFEISKNEGERHGRMPTFGRTTGQPRIPNGEEFESDEDDQTQAETKTAQPLTKQPSKKKEEDLITIVDLMKEDEPAKPSPAAAKKDVPKSASKTPSATPPATTKKVEEAKPVANQPPKAKEVPKEDEE